MRIVFAGTPDFAACAFERLLKHGTHDVVAAYTQPDRPAGRGRKLIAGPVKQLALAHDIPVLQPPKMTQATVAELAAFCPDVLVVAAYGNIIPADVLNVPFKTCLNIHASLLPRWRGAAPIQRAILAGDVQTGISIMQVVPALDAGPVMMSAATTIETHDDAGTLHDRLANLGAELLLQSLDAVENGSASYIEQDETRVTYAAKIEKSELALQLDRSATLVARQVRAFAPRPGAWTDINGVRTRVLKADASNADHELAPGTLVQSGPQTLGLSCGEGVLWLREVQPAGGKAQDIRAFLNGHQALAESALQFKDDGIVH